MIIQCDQCNTKFKLDDAKVPEKGIKVRCAKCKQVFMVQKETTPEEPDLDFLLSGLGTQAPDAEKGLLQAGEAASPTTEGEGWQTSAQGHDTIGETPAEPFAGGVGEQTQGEEFEEEFFATKEEPVAMEEKGPDYGDFSFEEENNISPSKEVAQPASAAESVGEFEFGEFPFEEESTAKSDAAATLTDIPAETKEFDFGDVEFTTDESAQTSNAGEVAGVTAEKPTEEGFTFGEQDKVPQPEHQVSEGKPDSLTGAGETFEFSEFAPSPKEGKDAENAPLISTEDKREAEAETPDFGNFEFGETPAAETEVSKEGEDKAKFDFAPEQVAPTASTPVSTSPAPVTEPDIPSYISLMPSAEDELPPLAISTRKKGRSIFSVTVKIIVVLIVLAIAGVGFYVFKTGPQAFNKLGLSFLAKWAGMDVAEEGGITIINPQGAFMVNKAAGEIFVVSGEAVNNFKKPRASIQVKAVVMGPKGEMLMQKSAYCGNSLSKEQLATLPMDKIEEAMGSPFGDSLSNLSVPPGKGIPFVIVFSGVQKNAADFTVEVVGSTVAGQ